MPKSRRCECEPLRVSVVVRSRNDASIIERTLDALAQQTLPHELLCVDNASRDGTRELLVERKVRIHDVPEGAYVPGRVLNEAVARTEGDIVVFVNSDAPPLHDDFLALLTAPLVAGDADAVWARQIARPAARASTRLDHARMFGDSPPPASWGPRFSLAASAILRRRLVERRFSECVQYSEDLEWVVDAARRGLVVRYVPEARVEHSHDYTLREAAKRFFEEGRADAAIFVNGGRPLRPLGATLGYVRDVLRDGIVAARAGELGTALLSPAYRAVQRYGYVLGRLVGPRTMGGRGPCPGEAAAVGEGPATPPPLRAGALSPTGSRGGPPARGRRPSRRSWAR